MLARILRAFSIQRPPSTSGRCKAAEAESHSRSKTQPTCFICEQPQITGTKEIQGEFCDGCKPPLPEYTEQSRSDTNTPPPTCTVCGTTLIPDEARVISSTCDQCKQGSLAAKQEPHRDSIRSPTCVCCNKPSPEFSIQYGKHRYKICGQCTATRQSYNPPLTTPQAICPLCQTPLTSSTCPKCPPASKPHTPRDIPSPHISPAPPRTNPKDSTINQHRPTPPRPSTCHICSKPTSGNPTPHTCDPSDLGQNGLWTCPRCDCIVTRDFRDPHLLSEHPQLAAAFGLVARVELTTAELGALEKATVLRRQPAQRRCFTCGKTRVGGCVHVYGGTALGWIGPRENAALPWRRRSCTGEMMDMDGPAEAECSPCLRSTMPGGGVLR